jgi:Polyketide cyclase / dehydrase and lipid transport
MVAYESDQVFPFPRERVWKLLNDHLDDELITKIHPLVKQSRTVSRDASSVVFDRKIDARGRILASQWRVTARPPDTFRWDIVTSNGPYAAGSWMENNYTEEGGSTRIRSRGDLKITVLPFFIPQRPIIRRVFDDIDAEDQAYLRG